MTSKYRRSPQIVRFLRPHYLLLKKPYYLLGISCTYSSFIFSNFYFSFQPYLIHRLHNSSDIIFSSTSSFSPTCRTTWTGWCKRHFWKILKILSNFDKFVQKFLSLFWIWSFSKKAEALLRSSCKHKLANNSQVLVQKSQILLEIA